MFVSIGISIQNYQTFFTFNPGVHGAITLKFAIYNTNRVEYAHHMTDAFENDSYNILGAFLK